ncbi:hypothetical protein HJA90_10985 [Rhizobium bangladeshense]|uniref:hypothetical protein n=1 Tax=Rhizobium bangladeshense TaxID=1138189 RepID=UPI001C8396EC|nr:hypothetical protein [Rhizobium bangladeshense]MBX4884104.1 hypothetical protein [Rhizobium bangladeshense]
MARWQPGDVVKPSEVIGRRLFDKSLNAPIDVQSLSPNLFLDTRYDEDLSLDRLGDGQAHRAVVTRLTPSCDEEATKQRSYFRGWFATQRKNVKFENVLPDVLTTERDGIDNPFHALLDRSAAREKGQAWHLSRSLFMTFKESGQIVHPIRPNAE